jgi:hypothetical protein
MAEFLRGDEEEDVSSYWLTKGHERILETERGSTRSHSVENWLLKSLWTCRKADYGMVKRNLQMWPLSA